MPIQRRVPALTRSAIPPRCAVGLILALALPLLGPLRAAAQEPPTEVAGALVAVLPPEFSASVSEGARATLMRRLVEGLTAARFNVVSGEELLKRLGGDAAALGCHARDCYPALAKRLRVAYLVVSNVKRVERNYELTLALVRGRSGEPAAELRERCDICGIEEVGEKMGLAASSLRTKLEALVSGPARLVVRSTPPGAFVYLDGAEIGRTPLEREIPGGQHTLRLRHRGHLAAERTVTLVPEVAETIDVLLIRAADTFPYATVGWTALGVGVLAIGAGAAMVAIDGREISCAAAQQDAFSHCPKVRNTRVAGAVLAGIGAALATGGGLFVWLARDRGSGAVAPRATAPRWRASMAPFSGGAQLSLGREF